MKQERLARAQFATRLWSAAAIASGLLMLALAHVLWRNRKLRRQRPLSIAVVDLDNFKALNDRFGHACGDAALADFGALCWSAYAAIPAHCDWQHPLRMLD